MGSAARADSTKGEKKEQHDEIDFHIRSYFPLGLAAIAQ
jgi:hypothetical protein